MGAGLATLCRRAALASLSACTRRSEPPTKRVAPPKISLSTGMSEATHVSPSPIASRIAVDTALDVSRK